MDKSSYILVTLEPENLQIRTAEVWKHERKKAESCESPRKIKQEDNHMKI